MCLPSTFLCLSVLSRSVSHVHHSVIFRRGVTLYGRGVAHQAPFRRMADNARAGPAEPAGRADSKARSKGKRNDNKNVHISKTVSFILRHGAHKMGLAIRPDGFVRVSDLLASKQLSSVSFLTLQEIVQNDQKQRFKLLYEPVHRTEVGSSVSTETDVWWIKANQGHSMADIELDLLEITSAAQVRMAVHGTNPKAWEIIKNIGLSRMNRKHIHFSQGIVGDTDVISGMRSSAQVFIHADLRKALAAGIRFFVSDNGVVLSRGDERGILEPKYFARVEGRDGRVITGWEPEEEEEEEEADVEGDDQFGVSESSRMERKTVDPETARDLLEGREAGGRGDDTREARNIMDHESETVAQRLQRVELK